MDKNVARPKNKGLVTITDVLVQLECNYVYYVISKYCDLIGDFKILKCNGAAIVAMTQVPPVIVTRPDTRLDKTNVNVDTVCMHVES